MRAYLFIVCLVLTALQVQAQDESNLEKIEFDKKNKNKAAVELVADTLEGWHLGAITSINFSQSSHSNWQAGAQNALNLNAVTGLIANWEKGRHYWFSLLDASYGLTKIEESPVRKATDYWELNTKYGYRFHEKWSFTVFAEGISQFTPGFNYVEDPEGLRYTSNFFAPANLNQGVGLSYDHKKAGLSARIAPLTAREVVVLDKGVDETAYGLDSGAVARVELGASMRVNFQKQLGKNLNVESRLLVFSNYLENPQNLYINWRNKVDLKVTKIISVNFLLHLIYDPNVDFILETETTPEGLKVPKRVGPALQYLQNLGVGISFNLSNTRP
ncbi:MAG: DUF3078 domain-containing protein [Bacteroidetes bacterium]|nr:DUF3078 domain-containing protein [Bacteroidota bacterium]